MASSDPIVVDRHNDLPFSGERRTVAASVARPRGGAGAARAVAASAYGRASGAGVRPLQRLVRQPLPAPPPRRFLERGLEPPPVDRIGLDEIGQGECARGPVWIPRRGFEGRGGLGNPHLRPEGLGGLVYRELASGRKDLCGGCCSSDALAPYEYETCARETSQAAVELVEREHRVVDHVRRCNDVLERRFTVLRCDQDRVKEPSVRGGKGNGFRHVGLPNVAALTRGPKARRVQRLVRQLWVAGPQFPRGTAEAHL